MTAHLQPPLTPPELPERTPPDDAYFGLAGRAAQFFIRSPLSPLFYVAMLLMGIWDCC